MNLLSASRILLIISCFALVSGCAGAEASDGFTNANDSPTETADLARSPLPVGHSVVRCTLDLIGTSSTPLPCTVRFELKSQELGVVKEADFSCTTEAGGSCIVFSGPRSALIRLYNSKNAGTLPPERTELTNISFPDGAEERGLGTCVPNGERTISIQKAENNITEANIRIPYSCQGTPTLCRDGIHFVGEVWSPGCGSCSCSVTGEIACTDCVQDIDPRAPRDL